MLLSAVQIIVAISLIIVILLQVQGSGLSGAFGAGGEFYRSKRSIERLLGNVTIILAILFAVISVLLLLPS